MADSDRKREAHGARAKVRRGSVKADVIAQSVTASDVQEAREGNDLLYSILFSMPRASPEAAVASAEVNHVNGIIDGIVKAYGWSMSKQASDALLAVRDGDDRTLRHLVVFFALYAYPAFLGYLLDPGHRRVFNPDSLRHFVQTDVRKACKDVLDGKESVDAMVSNLRAKYVSVVGVFRP